jgi:hypothetical protein
MNQSTKNIEVGDNDRLLPHFNFYSYATRRSRNVNFDNKNIKDILTPDLKEHVIKLMRSEKSNFILNEPLLEEIQIKIPIAKPTYTLICADLVGETSKAYNLRVYLNPKAYTFDFPFQPSLYSWFPKSLCNKLNVNYWEVKSFILTDNLNKSLEYLKQTLIKKYEFTEDEVGSIVRVYLK